MARGGLDGSALRSVARPAENLQRAVRGATVGDLIDVVCGQVCGVVRVALVAGAPVAVCLSVCGDGGGAAGPVRFPGDLGRRGGAAVSFAFTLMVWASGLVLQLWASRLSAGL